MHILSGELILHKRTLEPVKTMLYGLRRYDSERTVAVKLAYVKSLSLKGRRNVGLSGGGPSRTASDGSVTDRGVEGDHTPPAVHGEQTDGYMSYTAKIYLVRQ